MAVHPSAVREQIDQASVDRERAEGDHDGGQAQVPHQQAVERAEHRAACNRDRNHDINPACGKLRSTSAATMPDSARLDATDRSTPRVMITSI